MNYYNEFDPHAAAWLRELIARKLIPDGIVDERSITEIHAPDLSSFVQCHFFAGIGGWSLALQLAGWPEDRPVWTGSCPCQPYSAAGKGLGDKDERNLWPIFFNLIRECRPDTVFGEQVESAIGHGWLDGIRADLEGEGYACGDVTLGAHSVGSPHQRQRLYWVADAGGIRHGELERDAGTVCSAGGSYEGGEPKARRAAQETTHCGSNDGLGDAFGEGLQGHGGDERDGSEPGRIDTLPPRPTAATGSVSGGVGNPTSGGFGEFGDAPRARSGGHSNGPSGASGGVGDSQGDDEQRTGEFGAGGGWPSETGGSGPWTNAYWLPCRDGKHRRVPAQSVFFFESDGIPNSMGDRWLPCLAATENQILSHAKNTETDPGKILRSLWNQARKETLQRHSRGYDEIPIPKILLVALLQLAWNPEFEDGFSASDLIEIEERTMRILREETDQPEKSTRTPLERGLARPPAEKSSDTVCRLSPQAPPEENKTLPLLFNSFPEEWHVPEAWAAVQEVWRSIPDQNPSERERTRLRVGAGLLVAAKGFPLASGDPFKLARRGSVRPALLKGAGNAIVPQVAAEFIQASIAAIE